MVCHYCTNANVTPLCPCGQQAMTFNQVIQTGPEEEGGDDKAVTAMGILNTIDTLLSVVEDHKEVGSTLTQSSFTHSLSALGRCSVAGSNRQPPTTGHECSFSLPHPQCISHKLEIVLDGHTGPPRHFLTAVAPCCVTLYYSELSVYRSF